MTQDEIFDAAKKSGFMGGDLYRIDNTEEALRMIGVVQ